MKWRFYEFRKFLLLAFKTVRVSKQFLMEYKLFFISNTFISDARLKLVKNQAKAKQHSEAELLLFENYSLSLTTLSSKNQDM